MCTNSRVCKIKIGPQKEHNKLQRAFVLCSQLNANFKNAQQRQLTLKRNNTWFKSSPSRRDVTRSFSHALIRLKLRVDFLVNRTWIGEWKTLKFHPFAFHLKIELKFQKHWYVFTQYPNAMSYFFKRRVGWGGFGTDILRDFVSSYDCKVFEWMY